MTVLKYFSSLVDELNRKSEVARDLFSTHKPSVGDHRESSVTDLLSKHLPQRFSVSSGLILDSTGTVSNQSDIIISDALNNAPLFDGNGNDVWLVESVYSVIEVKTQLTPSTLKDCIAKCQQFKKMKRVYFQDHVNQKITDSLFVIWGFNSPSSEVLYNNYKDLIKNIPIEEQPDFVICPDKLLITGGAYRQLQVYGQSGSVHNVSNDYNLGLGVFETDCLELNNNSLITFIAWLNSWLQAAGDRTTMLGLYVQNEKNIGHRVF